MNFSFVHSDRFIKVSSESIDEYIPSLPTKTLSLLISAYTDFSHLERSIQAIIDEPDIHKSVIRFKKLLPDSEAGVLISIMEHQGVPTYKIRNAISNFNQEVRRHIRPRIFIPW